MGIKDCGRPKLIYPCGFEFLNENLKEKQEQAIDKVIEKGYLPIYVFNDDINNKENLIPTKFKIGIEKHPTYNHWITMLLSCYDKGYESYEKYGAKGVSVKIEWINSFEQFCKDMEISTNKVIAGN